MITDANGIPLAVKTTPANIHDGTMAIEMLDAIPPIRGQCGRPLRRPYAYQGDRAYGWQNNIDAVRIRGVIPELARPQDVSHGSGLGKTRYVVERTLSWFNNHRRLRLCYEKTGPLFDAFHQLASVLICFNIIVFENTL